MLHTLQDIIIPDTRDDRQKVVVLLTDGKPSSGQDPCNDAPPGQPTIAEFYKREGKVI